MERVVVFKYCHAIYYLVTGASLIGRALARSAGIVLAGNVIVKQSGA